MCDAFHFLGFSEEHFCFIEQTLYTLNKGQVLMLCEPAVKEMREPRFYLLLFLLGASSPKGCGGAAG